MSKIKKTYGNTKSLTEIVVKGARQHNLKNINLKLWDIEDGKRSAEKNNKL